VRHLGSCGWSSYPFRLLAWSACCVCTLCSNGMAWPMKRWKTRSAIAQRSAALSELIWDWKKRPMPPRCSNFAGCWRRTNSPRCCSISPDVRWSVAAKRSIVKGMNEGPLKVLTQALEKVKAQVRARVEHPFHIIKNLFKHKKARYRGLSKNGAQLDTLFALANLVIAKKSLLRSTNPSAWRDDEKKRLRNAPETNN